MRGSDYFSSFSISYLFWTTYPANSCLELIFMLPFIILSETTLQSKISATVLPTQHCADRLAACWYVGGGSEFVHCQASALSFHIMTAGCKTKFWEVVGALVSCWWKRKHCQMLQAYYSWSISACEPFLCSWQLGACYLRCVMLQSGNGDGGKNAHVWYTLETIQENMQNKSHCDYLVFTIEVTVLLLTVIFSFLFQWK